MRIAVLSILVLVGSICCVSAANAQGKGIGRQVSQAARSGVHGPQLAQMIQGLNAARGVGQSGGPAGKPGQSGGAGQGVQTGGAGKGKGQGQGAGGPGKGMNQGGGQGPGGGGMGKGKGPK